jgi:hypothetical protein
MGRSAIQETKAKKDFPSRRILRHFAHQKEIIGKDWDMMPEKAF